MGNSSIFVIEDNQVNQERPPPRVCPRCYSSNTRFGYNNNKSVDQPRYKCMTCRRHWTHGGTLRKNVLHGASDRKTKRTTVVQPSASQAVSAEIQHQPLLHGQEINQFVGSFGGSSSDGNQFGSFPETYGDMLRPFPSIPPMVRPDFYDGVSPQEYYSVGFDDLIGNPLTNQSIDNYMNQEEQDLWNEIFNDNTMNMDDNGSTSGNREYSDSTDHMNKSNGVDKPSYHLERDGP